MKNIIKLFLITLIVSCQIQTNPAPGPTPAPIPTVPTPPPSPPAGACQKAQDHLSSLCQADAVVNQYCCAVVMMTKKGKSFAQFCEEEQAKSVFVNPECLASVTTCDDIDYCTTQSQ